MVRRSLFAVTLTACMAVPFVAVLFADEPHHSLPSATESNGNKGVFRWDVKVDSEVPPDVIPASHRVKPSDLAGWLEPRGRVTSHTPRSGKEQEWWELTGQVMLIKVEDDQDIHIQLADEDNSRSVQVVVEVPVKQHPGDSPWDELRSEIFGWSNAEFPLRLPHSLTLHSKPVIRVEGKAFFDAQHRVLGRANRRNEEYPVAVWELHPVMTLSVIKK